MNVLVFDIKTMPDIDGARRLYDLHGLSDEDVAKAIFHKRRQQANTDLLQHHLHKIVAISAVLVNSDNFKVWSLGDINSTEQDLLQRFYDGLERYSPQLVSWNGNGFNLPVIHYRSLLYPVNALRYWDTGQHDSQFRHNNYLSRVHQRHTDLMDVLSGYHTSATVTLDEAAALFGFPGKTALPEKKLWGSYQAEEITKIREINESDVLKTYLIFLNWQRNRGHIDPQQYIAVCQKLRQQLKNSSQSHLIEFETSWIDL